MIQQSMGFDNSISIYSVYPSGTNWIRQVCFHFFTQYINFSILFRQKDLPQFGKDQRIYPNWGIIEKICHTFNITSLKILHDELRARFSLCQHSENKEASDFSLKEKQQCHLSYLLLLQDHHRLDHDSFEWQD